MDGKAPGSWNVRAATLDLLRGLGMTTVFGNPGSTELPSSTAGRRLHLRARPAGGLGAGHGRWLGADDGRAAFVNLHSAAGVGHALGNLFTAHRNAAPLVITAGQQARALLPNLPFLGATDAASFPKPYVKFSVEPARAEDVPGAIAQAWRVAMQRPRGPTFVSVPSDDWGAPCRLVPARVQHADAAPDPQAIAEAAHLLAAARRPVIVSGAEADAEGCGTTLVALAERLGAPVWTAPFAARLAFPEDHPLHAGHLAAAPAAVSDALSAHDLVLVAGAPVFTFHVSGDCALFRSGVPILHLTADTEAAAAAPAGTTILGALRHALPALTALLPDRGLALPAPRARPAPPAPATPIPAGWALSRLRAALPPDALLVEEAPSHRPAMHAHLPVTRWGGFLTMASGGLGYALPAAVGAAIAQPGRRVALLIGDGFLSVLAAGAVDAVQHRLPLAVIVLNNGGYGALRSFSQVLQIRGAPGIDVPGVDHVGMARSMGCPGERVAAHGDLDAALGRALAAEGPHLVEVLVDPAIPQLYAGRKDATARA
jgi:benzoylformate decarboxylase